MVTHSLTSAHAINCAGRYAAVHWLTAALETAAVASGTWPLTPEPGPAGWTCSPRVATRTPVADARAVRQAREFAISTMRRWGVAQRREDITVVVSELMTNALRHAAPAPHARPHPRPIQLGLLQPGPCILCVVADPSPRPPIPEEPGFAAETGRGLHVIEALSDNWGYAALCDRGKSVWAIVSTTPPG